MNRIAFIISLILLFSCTEKKEIQVEKKEKTALQINKSVLGVSLLDSRQLVIDVLTKKGYEIEIDDYVVKINNGVVFNGYYFSTLEYLIGDKNDAKVYGICACNDFSTLKEANDYYNKIIKNANTKYGVYKTKGPENEYIACQAYEDDKTLLFISIHHQPSSMEGIPHPEILDDYERQLLSEKWEVAVSYNLSRKEIEKMKK